MDYGKSQDCSIVFSQRLPRPGRYHHLPGLFRAGPRLHFPIWNTASESTTQRGAIRAIMNPPKLRYFFVKTMPFYNP